MDHIYWRRSDLATISRLPEAAVYAGRILDSIYQYRVQLPGHGRRCKDECQFSLCSCRWADQVVCNGIRGWRPRLHRVDISTRARISVALDLLDGSLVSVLRGAVDGILGERSGEWRPCACQELCSSALDICGLQC